MSEVYICQAVTAPRPIHA